MAIRLGFGALVLGILFALGVPGFGQRSVQRPDVTGTEFLVVFPNAPFGNQTVGVLVNSPIKQTITVQQGRSPVQKFTVQKDSTIFITGLFNIESSPELLPPRKNRLTKIISEYPITVHGQYGVNAIAGTFTVLPTSAWGSDYYVEDLPEGINDDYLLYPNVYSVPTVTIMALHKETGLTITPRAVTASGKPADTPWSISLDSGDIFTLSTAGDPKATPPRAPLPCEADLSGTHISSNKPIGVIVAQSHTSEQCGFNDCGDYGVEWLPPYTAWDSLFVLPASITRLSGITEHYYVQTGSDTTLITQVLPSGGERIVGIFIPATRHEIVNDLTGTPPYVIHSNRPILPMIVTPAPNQCILDGGGDGGEPWNFSFNFVTGVNQWADNLTFSSPFSATAVQANITFRLRDTAKLFWNGVPFSTAFAGHKNAAGGFAIVSDSSVVPGKYYEIRGDGGARATGVLYGHGAAASGPGGDGGDNHVLNPTVIKSFAHPIGFNGLPYGTQDTLPPYDSITVGCGHWTVTTSEPVDDNHSTGLSTIVLIQDGPDVSSNVKFSPAPIIGTGMPSVTYGIDVVNLLTSARAVLRVRDVAGNEFDTVLIFNPQRFDAIPTTADVGAVRGGDTVSKLIKFINRSPDPVTFSKSVLKSGAHWAIVAPSPTAPFTVSAGDSTAFRFLYTSPVTQQLECDDDTLLLTTCKEFPAIPMHGCNKHPVITVQGFDYGDLRIDTLGRPGQQRTNPIVVRNIGSDTMHVTGFTLKDAMASTPDSDFVILANQPSVASPWRLKPDSGVTVLVAAHPHHTGPRAAYLIFTSDAAHYEQDTALLQVYGLPNTSAVRSGSTPGEVGLLASYPNPSGGVSTVEFNAALGKTYVVKVFDNLGVLVRSVAAEPISGGRFRATWGTTGLRTGIYNYEVCDGATGMRIPGSGGRAVLVK